MRQSFWMYQASEATPTLDEAIATGAVASDTTLEQWHSLTPGMRREIVRTAKKIRA